VTLPAGVGLDLGGMAKGLAVDAAVSCLRGLGVEAALVNAGGDLAVHGGLPGGAAWPVVVEGRAAPQVVLLERGALATSGIARRHWQQGPQRRHHLLDPRTGLPAQSGLWAVTVVAARCVQAEVAATAAFVLGPEAGARFLQERGLAGWLARDDGTGAAGLERHRQQRAGQRRPGRYRWHANVRHTLGRLSKRCNVRILLR